MSENERRAIITHDDMKTYLKQRLFLISHGGVGSEELTRRLGIEYSREKVGPKSRPFKGAFVHSPFPPEGGVEAGIYLFGDLFNAILSQMRRHPDNAKKMKNSELHPDIASIDDLTLADESDDPMGILAQFERFISSWPEYPLIFVRRDQLEASQNALARVTGTASIEWQDRARVTDWKTLDNAAQVRLTEAYGDLDKRMRQMPSLAIAWPLSAIDEKDGLSRTSQREFESLAWLLEPTLTVFEAAKPGQIHSGHEPRIKHALNLSDGRFAINLRIDTIGENGRPSQSHGHLVIFDGDGAASRDGTDRPPIVIDHPEIHYPETSKFAGFEDPRVIKSGSGDLIVMNGLLPNRERRIFIYDVNANTCRQVHVNGLTQNKVEKNWVPFILDDKLHLLYSLEPLVVLRQSDVSSTDRMYFDVVHKATAERAIRADSPWGSTPFVPWIPPYYVGFAHSRKPWRAVPVLLDVEGWRVAKSSPVDFPQPKGAVPWRNKSVQFPFDLRLDTGDPELYVEFEDRHPARIVLDVEDFSKEFARLRARLDVGGGS